MNIQIPQSGFFILKGRNCDIHEIRNRFDNHGAATKLFNDDQVLLASLKTFDDQGLWADSKNAVVYDMDLTNHSHLAKLVGIQESASLEKGILIWKLYEKYGIELIDKLRGYFAFALWDGKQKKLYVVNDPYGVKPVVYAQKDNTLLAGSRIKHLLWADPSFKEINSDAIFHYLFYQAVCTPLTIYRSIRKLPPGKAIETTDQSWQEFTHYDIKYNPDNTLTEADWKQRIREHMEKAVQTYVPLSPNEQTGCFLSGGTDSSSIAGYYTQVAGKPAKTFSIGFDHPRYNELEYARMAANRFKTEYHEYYVTPADVMKLIEQLPRIYDEPFGNASVIPAFYCADHAAQNGIDILLGGDGGDEIFGGNERYVTNLIFQKYLALPQTFRKSMFEPLLSLMPDQGVFYKAKRYVRRANIPNPQRFYSYNLLAETNPHTIFQEDFIQAANLNAFIDIAQAHYDQAAPADDTDRLLYLDMKFTITDNDIRKVTQMVEAAGLRVRYPLLDRDLVDFTCTIPPNLKVKWRKNRYIFKQAMKGFLPDEIITKSKHGMGLPVTPWFKQDKQMNTLLYDTLFTGTPCLQQYIRPEFIQNMKKAFESDASTYYGDNLWVFLILEMWLKQ